MILTKKRNMKCIKVLTIGFALLLTSCMYSGKYVASYAVDTDISCKEMKDVSIDYINQLADKYALDNIEPQYNASDTLIFYGQPYHSFKFWFEKEEKCILKVSYYGVFGNRRQDPYADFFFELDAFMKENFANVEVQVDKESNAK